jgi:hypothetical protein
MWGCVNIRALTNSRRQKVSLASLRLSCGLISIHRNPSQSSALLVLSSALSFSEKLFDVVNIHPLNHYHAESGWRFGDRDPDI